MKASTQKAMKEARQIATAKGHDLHGFQPLYGSLAGDTKAVCRTCGREVTVKIKRSGAAITGLAIAEECGP